MTLGEIVSYACGKVGLTDDTAKARARSYAAMRYQLIFRSALWKDALSIYTKALAANANTVILPSQVEKVLGVRSGSRALMPADQVFLFNDDPLAWERSGGEVQFTLPAVTALSGAPQTGGEKLRFVSSNNSDTTKKVTIYGRDANQEEATEVLTLNGTSNVDSVNSYEEVYLLSKDVTAGAVTVTGVSSTAALQSLRPTETLRRHTRVRIHDTPVEAVTLSVLAKRRPNPLENDTDSTLLPALDNALLALVLGDMLQWQDAYAKGNTCFDEGNALLESLKKTEVWQEARRIVMSPSDGCGDFERPWE
ncbi:MAG TPA: hypothetical protein VG838_00480 [Opitutaceae bacterium]|nr:hypothetical protein [Opitutaceae bacterium]